MRGCSGLGKATECLQCKPSSALRMVRFYGPLIANACVLGVLVAEGWFTNPNGLGARSLYNCLRLRNARGVRTPMC